MHMIRWISGKHITDLHYVRFYYYLTWKYNKVNNSGVLFDLQINDGIMTILWM